MADFASAHGLKTEKGCCFGEYDGYRVHVKYNAMGNPSCLLTVVTNTKGRQKELEKYLAKHKGELKLTNYGVVGIGLMVAPQLYTNVFRQIETILDKIVGYLRRAGYPGAEVCPYCGEALGEDRVELTESGIPFAAHSDCFSRAYAVALQKEENERRKPPRRGMGMLGGLLGILAAILVFVLFFIWWDFAALAAAVGTLFGGWLYGKFGGKNEPFRVVFVAVATLLLLGIAYGFCLYFSISLSGVSGGVVQTILENLRNDEAYRQSFLLNSIFLVVFDLVGTAYNLFSCLRARKKISASMRRVG